MSKPQEALRRGSEVELAVRNAGYFDLELSQSVSLLATPGNVTVMQRDREPVVNAMVPFVSTLMVGPSGDVSFGTAIFGMSSSAIPGCIEMANNWLDASRQMARELPVSRNINSRAVREGVYAGVRNGYASTIGGVALLRTPNKEFEVVTFATKELLDRFASINSSALGRIGLKAIRGFARSRGRAVAEEADTVTEQASHLLLSASTVARPRHDGEPVIVDQPFYATI